MTTVQGSRLRMPDMGNADLRDAVLRGSAVPISHRFAFQSYLDPTLGASAIVVPTNGSSITSPIMATSTTFSGPSSNGIAPGTLQPAQQFKGVGFALLPASETPVGVIPTFEKSPSHGSAVFLKPGQIYYPGVPFHSFQYGLPYGWLGGGVAHLVVLREFMGYAFWSGDKEVIFHRVTLPVNPLNTNITTYIAPNFPKRFPWPNAVAQDPNTGLRYQLPGQPLVSVTPTKTLLRLQLATPPLTPVGGGTTRLIFFDTDDMDSDASGEGNPGYIDVFWPQYTLSGLQIAGNTVTEIPTQTLTGPQCVFGGDAAQLVITTPDANIPSGSYLDIVRWGVL